MHEPAVVVITRTKNRPLLLERAIKSVVHQSYDDYVMIIVNDGGDQDLVERVIDKYAKISQGKIKAFHNKTSAGMETASNLGIKNSKSKYISLLDDDDTWHPDFLKETVNFLESNSYKGVVTGSEIVKETLEGNRIRILNKKRFAPEINQIRLFDLSGINQFPNNSFVYAREVIQKIGYYDPNAPVLGDWEFNLRFLRHYDIAFIDKPLAYYHHRETSKGPMANSLNLHAALNTRLLNRFLREDLDEKIFGLGILANISSSQRNLYNDTHQIEALVRELTNTSYELKNKLDKIESAVMNIEKEINKSSKFLAYRITRKLKRILLRTTS